MATVKIATLLIRTIAKPISAQIKQQAKQHERFRGFCVDLAQMMYRSEVRLRTNVLGEPAKHIRPLSETRAIENGANALAEGFLFTVAASIILAEAWRTSRNTSKRRDDVDDQLDDLGARVSELTTRMDKISVVWEQRMDDEKQRNDELTRILERIVEIGLRGGWSEFQDTPIQIPRIELSKKPHTPRPNSKTDFDDLNIDAPSENNPFPNNTPSDSRSQPISEHTGDDSKPKDS